MKLWLAENVDGGDHGVIEFGVLTFDKPGGFGNGRVLGEQSSEQAADEGGNEQDDEFTGKATSIASDQQHSHDCGEKEREPCEGLPAEQSQTDHPAHDSRQFSLQSGTTHIPPRF